MDASKAQQQEKNGFHLTEMVIASLDEAIITFDHNYQIKFCNTAAENITGFTAASLYNQSLFTFFPGLKEAEVKNNTLYQAEFRWNSHTKFLIKIIHQAQDEAGGMAIVKQIPEVSKVSESTRAVLEAIPQLAWASAPDGSINYTNTKWSEYTGRIVNEPAAWGNQAFIHPNDREITAQKWAQSMRTGKVYEHAVRLIKGADNVYQLHQARAVPVRDETGNITLWIGTCTAIQETASADVKAERQAFSHTYQQEIKEEFITINEQLLTQIQERKKAEDKLKESQQFIEQITDLAPCLITVYNIHSGKYIFTNKAFEKMLGYTREQLLAEGVGFLMSVMHPDDLIRVMEENQKAIQEANTYPDSFRHTQVNFEYRIRHSNGQWRWLHTVGTVFKRSADNTIESVLNVSVDITDRKTIEKKLQNKEQLITNLLENFPVVISRINKQGIYLESVGSGLREIDLIDNQLAGINAFDYYPHTGHHIRAVLQGEKTSFIDEFDYGGEKKFFQNYYFYDRDNECAVGFSIDITDQREAEEKLQESRLFIQQIADTMPDLMYVFDLAEQKNIYVNKEFTQLLGYSAEELKDIGTEVKATLLHPDDWAKAASNTQALFNLPDGEVHEWEYRMRHKNGEYRWFCSREIVFKRTPEGKPLQVLGIAQNITDRKSAQEKLLESQHFIQQIADATPDVLYVFDLVNHRAIYVNRQIGEILGYSPEQIFEMGDNAIQLLLHPEDLPKRYAQLQAFAGAEDNEIREVEYRVKDAQGNWRWILTRDTVFKRDASNNPVQIIGISRDVTERKRSEEELKNKNKIIEGILSNLPVIVSRIDRQGVIQEAIGSGLQRVGRIDNEIKGVNIFEAYPQVGSFIDKALHGESISFVGMPEFNGKRKYFLNHYFYDAEKECAIGFSIDISEQKEIEQKLIESENKLRQLNEELEQRVKERAAALAISEERFQLAAKVTHDVIWDWNLNTNQLTFSEGYNEMFGYTADETFPTIEAWYRYIHPEDVARVRNSIQATMDSRAHEWRQEYRLKRKNQTYAWVLDRGYVQYNTEGKPLRMVGAMADITKRKQSEEKLQASEAKFRRMFDSDVIGIIFWNLDGEITDANNAFLAMLGYTHADLLQRKIDWRALTPAEYTAGDHKALNELAATGVHAPVKKVYIHKKGYRVPVLVGGAFLEGFTDRGVSYILDMTDLENALKELALSEERFQLVAKATNDAIRDWNLVADMIWWNEGFRNLFGYTAAETDMGPESWYSRIHPDELERVLQSLREAIEQGNEQWTGEYRFRRSDGSYAYILDRGYILHNEKGKAIRILSSMLDITYLKETQEALEQQTIELKQSNADLEQFAFISSHDLQEPLNTASSFAKLLEKKYKNQLDEDANEFINFIVVSTGRMKVLVQSLLNYSKINSANKEMTPTNLSSVLDQVKENLQSVIEQTGAIIISEPLPELPANESQMVQLFQHLIGNAIKFRSERPVEIKINVTSQPKHYLFSVSDTGIGLEMQYAEKIFQVFQRLHSRDEYEGAGIGLATCKRIVEKHNGTIWVESEPGKGATFYFTLKK